MIRWDHWHIEPSSICTLQCPRCPRAEVPDSLLNRQLTLNFFKDQIGDEVIKKIRKITFCGNDGDPIYCRDFISICQWLKNINPSLQLVIITNGSYKTQTWWADLATVLNHHDEIHWSLDGWDQHSNQQYRINSNWESIQQGIFTFFHHNNTTYRAWDAIAFKFNEQKIAQMKSTALTQGFDSFQLTKSTKFGSKYPTAYGVDDALEPSDSNMVASAHRFERETFCLTNKIRPGDDLRIEFIKRSKQLNQYSGICLIGNKGVFLNSQGEFYPCCWTANRYKHNQSWHGRFNLNTKTFQDIITDSFWTTEFLKFDSLECKTKCTSDRLTDTSHISEW